MESGTRTAIVLVQMMMMIIILFGNRGIPLGVYYDQYNYTYYYIVIRRILRGKEVLGWVGDTDENSLIELIEEERR